MPTLSFFLLSPQVLTPIITTTSFTLNPASALALPLSTALMLTPLNPLDFDWKICRPSLAPCRLLIVVRTMPMATCLPRTCACACAVNMESMVKFSDFFLNFFQKRKMAHLGVRRLCSSGTPTAVTRMCSVLQHSQYNCNYHRCQATHSGFTRTTPHHRTLADDNNTVQDILFFFFTCLAGAFPSPHTKGIGRKESNVCRD